MDSEILSLKKELKCWESMFQRTYGRKPTKTDIDGSSGEIKDSYKRYGKLKNQENQAVVQKSSDDGVFGDSLNKSNCKSKPINKHITAAIGSSDVWTPPKIKMDIKKRLPSTKKKDSSKLQENRVVNENVEGSKDQVMSFQISTDVIENKCIQKTQRSSISRSNSFRKSIGNFTKISQDVLNECSNSEANSLSKTLPLEANGKYNELEIKDSDRDQIEKSDICRKIEDNIYSNTNGGLCNLSPDKTIKTLNIDFNTSAINLPDIHIEKNNVSAVINSTKLIACRKITESIEKENFEIPEDNIIEIEKKEDKIEKSKVKVQTKGKRKRNVEKDEVDEDAKNVKKVKLNKKAASKVKRLVSDNFVKIDLKKKTYQRGTSKLTGAQYKRSQWKKKTNFEFASKVGAKGGNKKICFRCGGEGHWAKFCRGPAKKVDPFSKLADEKNSMEFQHLNENAGSCFDHVDNGDEPDNPFIGTTKKFTIDDVLDIEPCWPRYPYITEPSLEYNEPLFQSFEYQPQQVAFDSVQKALKIFGFNSFREGQHDAIARIVSGLSTLVVLATGSGKSLCYQLPAYMYYKEKKQMTIVVSPLVALMQDQVANLPSFLPGAFLNSSMTKLQKQKVIKKIKDGLIAVLLVSPEALVSGGFGTGILPPKSSLPDLAFACIDEAHCLSEWSHNFRPSYLKVCKALRDKYNIKCLLGLTATASQTTAKSVVQHLGISSHMGSIIRDPNPIPENLRISASRDENRDQALVEILQQQPFLDCDSIIVYVTRRTDADRLAVMLRTCLPEREPRLKEASEKEVSTKKKKVKSRSTKNDKPSWHTSEAYHAGQTPAQRRRTQTQFMSGELRIVVATVAFGMGLDKSDVRSVIHYNMPKSFENFVQEIGRAGRDGKPSYCHVFIDEETNDLNELRRHIYGNSIDRSTVKKFVEYAFPHCGCHTLNETHLILQENSNSAQNNGSTMNYENNYTSDNLKEEISDSELEFYFSKYADDSMELDKFENNDDILSQSSKENNKEENENSDVVSSVSKFESDVTVTCIKNNVKQLPNVTNEIVNKSPKSAECAESLNESLVCESIENTSTLNGSPVCDSKKEVAALPPLDNTVEEPPRVGNITTTSTSYQVSHRTDKFKKLHYCSGHRFSLCIDDLVNSLDMPEENIATLMSYLELHHKNYLQILNPIRAECSVKCYGGVEQFQLLARKFPPVALAIKKLPKSELKYLHTMQSIDLNLCEIADMMCWDVLLVAREVRSLQWNMMYALDAPLNKTGKSGIIVESEKLSFHGITAEMIKDSDIDDITDFLYESVVKQEETRLLQLDALYNVLKELSCKNYALLPINKRMDHHARECISKYFLSDEEGQIKLLKEISKEDTRTETPSRKWNMISGDIRNLMVSFPDQEFTGRAAARVFQGINSPCYPAWVYGRDRRFWRQHLDVDFNELRKFAVQQIRQLRS